MNSSFRKLFLLNLLVLIVLVGGGFTGYYFYNQNINYLKTDNAQIQGQAIAISAPAAGKITAWNGVVGKKYRAGDVLGTVQVANPAAAADANASPFRNMDITIPQDGTIVEQNVVVNAYTSPAFPLAHAYDLEHMWVTANIKETNLNDISKGDYVDIYADAYPDTTLNGRITQIGLYTASTFSILPSSNSSGNYTKVTQVIPVSISIDGNRGLNLVPGMNVSVRIHK